MEFHMYNFKNLLSDMRKQNQEIDKFSFIFNKIVFEVIIDISNSPFDLLVGARAKNWACTMHMKSGYSVTISDSDFYSL